MLLVALVVSFPSFAQNAMPEGLIGQPRDTVARILEENGIRYQVVYRNTCDFHLTVIETDPVEGQNFPDGLVYAIVTVTTGSAERVPSIIDLEPKAAQDILGRQRLALRLVDSEPPGHWCSVFIRDGTYSKINYQSPAAGAVVCPESEITGARTAGGYRVSQMTDYGCM